MLLKINPTIKLLFLLAVTISMVFALEALHEHFRISVSSKILSIGTGGYLVNYAIIGFTSFLAGATPFAVAELLGQDNRERLRRIKSYLVPLSIWASYYILTTIVVMITVNFKRIFPITSQELPFELPFLIHFLLFIILIDFFGYWFHRLEHRLPILWRFHSTHHSLTNINAFNQYGHWFEGMFRFFIVYLPMAILLPMPDISASSIAVIWAVWTLYVHTDSPYLALPVSARKVLVDNVYHHCHHGIEKKYHDCNFGFFFSIWDQIFGTANIPTDNQLPPTGLEDIPPPASPMEYLVHPFFSKSKRDRL